MTISGGSSRPIRVNDSIRKATEFIEAANLSDYAAKSALSEGRPEPEPEDPIRTAFQRDRDRILHCKSFRRLKHKTQVFIDPLGDHYRTRMTHSLEVSQVARTIGRALRLNEDLIEAIALGHDMGHTPFGHAGEEALDEAIKAHPNSPVEGFNHHEQSLRVVDVLERLNLSQETRRGIGGHSKGRGDLTTVDGQPTSTLEAAVVRISDRVAYMNHDLDDAIRSHIIDEVPGFVRSIGEDHGSRVGVMVEDIISHSVEKPAIMMSPSMLTCLNDLKEWLFENVYLKYPKLYPDTAKATRIVGELFEHYATPGNLPDGFDGVQGAIDYVAGMTDRFAIDAFSRLRIPNPFGLP